MFFAMRITVRFTVCPTGLAAAVFVLAGFLAGCGSDFRQEDTKLSEEPLTLEISPVEVKALLDGQADFFLLDCREAEEFQTASIAGATLLPMSEIQQRIGELEPHRDRHVVVHCHLGGRSMQVTQWLRQQGFDRVQSMAGGITAWSDQIDPSVPTY